MKDFTDVVMTKGDDTRIATSPRERVQLKAEGYRVAGNLPAPKPFDPSEHTVEEVLAHLDDADGSERERIYEAEIADKNRSTLLAALEAQEPGDEV